MADDLGVFDRVWNWFFKTLHWGWNLLLTIAAFFILASWVCWAFKIQCNFLFIGFILAGAWAVRRLSPELEKAKDVGIRLLFYFALTIGTILFFVTWLPKTTLNAYVSWAITGYNLKGFILIFAPAICIVLLSTTLSLLSTEVLKWSKRWMVFCLLSCMLGLLLYMTGVTVSMDKSLRQKLINWSRDIEVSRLNDKAGDGSFVKVKTSGTPVYVLDSKIEGKFNLYTSATLEADDLIRLNNTDEQEGIDSNVYLNVSGELTTGIENFYVNLRDVVVIPADHVYQDKNCLVLKEGNVWTVKIFTDEQFQLPGSWDKMFFVSYSGTGGAIEICDGKTTMPLRPGIGFGPYKGMPLPPMQGSVGQVLTLRFR